MTAFLPCQKYSKKSRPKQTSITSHFSKKHSNLPKGMKLPSTHFRPFTHKNN
jgi:hypothetical protein